MKEKVSITPTYMTLSILFTVCLLISNIVANRMIQFGPWSLTSAVIIFPLSYILGDIITEVYGFKAARKVMWMGFIMNALMAGIFTLVIHMPAPGWFEHNPAYMIVLGSTPRLLGASMAAYLIGSWVNATVLSRMKVKATNKNVQGFKDSFGVRAIISTFLGEVVDSLIFVPIGFLGVMPFDELLKMVILQITIKTVYEIVILPITSLIVKRVKIYDNVDIVDHGEKYNLFG